MSKSEDRIMKEIAALVLGGLDSESQKNALEKIEVEFDFKAGKTTVVNPDYPHF